MSFMCDYENEIFTKDIEDLKDFKELGMELQEIKKSACYGYRLFVGTSEDTEEVIYVYLKTTDYTLEEASKRVINKFINLDRDSLMNWIKEVEDGNYYLERFEDYDREKLLNLVTKVSLANLEYAEENLEENYYEDIDIIKIVENIVEEIQLKEEPTEEEEKVLNLLTELYQ